MSTAKTSKIKNNLKYCTKAKIIIIGDYFIISKFSVSGKFVRFFQRPVEVSLPL